MHQAKPRLRRLDFKLDTADEAVIESKVVDWQLSRGEMSLRINAPRDRPPFIRLERIYSIRNRLESFWSN